MRDIILCILMTSVIKKAILLMHKLRNTNHNYYNI